MENKFERLKTGVRLNSLEGTAFKIINYSQEDETS